MRRPDDVAKAQWQDNWVFEWVVLKLLPLALHVPAAACHDTVALQYAAGACQCSFAVQIALPSCFPISTDLLKY
jgi:hypothetical protein